MIYLSPSFTDAEIMKACQGQKNQALTLLASRLAERNMQAAKARELLQQVYTLLSEIK